MSNYTSQYDLEKVFIIFLRKHVRNLLVLCIRTKIKCSFLLALDIQLNVVKRFIFTKVYHFDYKPFLEHGHSANIAEVHTVTTKKKITL